MSNSDKLYDFYLASPLFDDEDNAELSLLESHFKSSNVKVFSPRLDSKIDLRSAKTISERNQMAQAIFDLNINAINSSKIILINTIGTRHKNAIYADPGTMIEAGYAIAKNIPIVTYNFKGFGLNIMLTQKSVMHFSDLSLTNTEKLNEINAILAKYDELVTNSPDYYISEKLREHFNNFSEVTEKFN